jgi:hypothetical protein
VTARLTGGCLCGAVRYESSGPPILSLNCHCRDCQRASGGPFTSSLFVPSEALQVNGTVKFYDSKGESGQIIRRGFCPDCGSALFGRPAVLGNLVSIRPGTLDDPSSFRPIMDIYAASAQPWDRLDPDLPKHAKAPPGPS